MKISACNLAQKQTGFKGLWGVRTSATSNYNTLGIFEFPELNRLYPFADDTKQAIRNEYEESLLRTMKRINGEKLPFADEKKIVSKMPFTRAEFEAYKSKNGMKFTKKLLNDVDRKIENFLNHLTGNGLSMYKNTYKETFSIRSLFKKI